MNKMSEPAILLVLSRIITATTLHHSGVLNCLTMA